MSFRLAAYGICIENGRVLLVRQVTGSWSLPGGKVEQGEDPFDCVIREIAEETGHHAVVERLLGVDSRVIPSHELRIPGGPPHQNIGIYYRVRLAGGSLRSELNGDTVEPAWLGLDGVARVRRSSLVDIGIELATRVPADGHVPPVATGGLVEH